MSEISSPDQFICNWQGCGRTFRQKNSLTRHQHVHTKHRPFTCDIFGCNKAFSQKCSLDVHVRSHTGVRPYPCNSPGCDKKFKSSSNRARHQKMHERHEAVSSDMSISNSEASFMYSSAAPGSPFMYNSANPSSPFIYTSATTKSPFPERRDIVLDLKSGGIEVGGLGVLPDLSVSGFSTPQVDAVDDDKLPEVPSQANMDLTYWSNYYDQSDKTFGMMNLQPSIADSGSTYFDNASVMGGSDAGDVMFHDEYSSRWEPHYLPVSQPVLPHYGQFESSLAHQQIAQSGFQAATVNPAPNVQNAFGAQFTGSDESGAIQNGLRMFRFTESDVQLMMATSPKSSP